MFKVIEGIYKQGKIIIPQLPDIDDQAKVFIAFTERSSQIEDITDFIESKKIALELPGDLDEIDVSINTETLYKARLVKAADKRKKKKILHSPFFSSSPVDIGYTDASMLDTIIAEGKPDGNLS